MIETEIRCIFCDITASPSNIFVTDVRGSICSDCTEICSALIRENQISFLLKNLSTSLKKPKEIKTYLDDYIIGQEKSKKILSVAVYNHYKRLEIQKLYSNCIIQKSNIMILGGTGTGKTYIMEKISEFLEVPIFIADATQFTESGYVGLDVNIMLRELYLASNKDKDKTEKGIIYIDEIDKIADKGGKPSGDIGVQQALLKMVESAVMDVPLRGAHVGSTSADAAGTIKIDTRNILFICGGAFSHLKEVIKQKMTRLSAGFASEIKDLNEGDTIYSKITNKDLIDYGILNEFLGRFPVRVYLNDLTKDDLKRILTEPKDALIKQFQMLMEFDKIKLIFDDEAIDKMTEEILKLEIGARGARTILEKVLNDIMFDITSENEEREIVITQEMVK